MTESATLPELLDRAASIPDTGLRLLDRHLQAEWLPWSEIRDRAQRIAGGLQELGVCRGERVALIYPTCAGFFEALFGVLVAGAVPAPLYPPVRLGRLDEYTDRTAAMLRAVDARLVLADGRVRRLLGEAVEAAAPDLGCLELSALPTRASRPVRVTDLDLALVQFSSGTTVDPKPVALSHRAVVAQTVRLNSFWPDGDGRVHSGASWLPLYHDMGLIGCVFPALERPAVLTLIPPELFVARPAVWLQTISRYRATVSPAPNFAYGLCAEKIRDEEMDGVDLSSWSVALNGAEPVAPKVLRKFQRRFSQWGFRPQALTPVYGLSEASLAVTFSDIHHPFSTRLFDRDDLADGHRAVESADGLEMVSLGRPLEGFKLRVVDRDRRDLPEGRVGKVLVRGPSLMDGYLGMEQATGAVLRDGWLDTGDLGFLVDGELFLTGREKDVLILRGRNHSPVEVEHALDAVDGVRTGCSAAFSFMAEDRETESLVVLVEARGEVAGAGYPEIASASARAVRAATGLQPDHVEVVPPGTLPRTSSGKIRRREAMQRWRGGALRPPQPVNLWRVGVAMVRSSLAASRSRRRREHS
ncbi:MAG: fatty acyl-AMP ligase [Acidobacteriota bacterium]|nr:fatty acyl-AMP ligase [Acidobacteriota bacterium]